MSEADETPKGTDTAGRLDGLVGHKFGSGLLEKYKDYLFLMPPLNALVLCQKDGFLMAKAFCLIKEENEERLFQIGNTDYVISSEIEKTEALNALQVGLWNIALKILLQEKKRITHWCIAVPN